MTLLIHRAVTIWFWLIIGDLYITALHPTMLPMFVISVVLSPLTFATLVTNDRETQNEFIFNGLDRIRHATGERDTAPFVWVRLAKLCTEKEIEQKMERNRRGLP